VKIAVCSQDYPHHVGGPLVWLWRFISELRKRNIECIVLFTVGGNGPEYKYISLLRDSGVKTYVYDGLDYTEHKVRWILEIIQKEIPSCFIPDYDVPAYYAGRWIREAGIPTIGILRSDDHLYRSINDIFLVKPNPYNPSAVVCVSKFLEELVSSNNNPNITIRRIPSGTPIPDYMAHKNGRPLRLIYMGRLIEEQKRISEVVKILCKTVRTIPDTEAYIYGSGKQKIVSKVIHIIQQEGAGLPIYYGGRVESDQIQDKLLEGHVCVLLSEYEGLPTSLVEAMACGLVPVCTNIRSGIPEIVIDGLTGILVKNRDDDFIRAIKRLKYENGLWERLSNAAREKVELEYSTEYSVKKWLNLLDDLKTQESTYEIGIPSKIYLPDYNDNFKEWDHRWPGVYSHYIQNIKKVLLYYYKKLLRLIGVSVFC
jgi:colanic acid/amylovoran biosynthesis glycosyltransferase